MSCFQLVKQDGDKLLVVNEGIQALNRIQGEVSVICIAGLYRTGKSLFLNFLVDSFTKDEDERKGMFTVGSTTKSCTRGIWMVVLEEQGLVFLDTEGLASVDQDETYDTKIFTIGLLLSSYFVYNSMGVIDETALERLYMVAKFAQKVSQTNKVLFSLLWLLRDFSLSLEEEYENDSNKYFEAVLQDKVKRKESGEHRKEIRKMFKRECRTLIRPVFDEADLRNLNKTENMQELRTKLRPEFLLQMDDVIALIKSKTKPKKLSGQSLNGPSLGKFLQSCLDSINGGSIPDIKKTFEYIAEQTYMELFQEGEQFYKQEMEKTSMCSNFWELYRKHEDISKQALDIFDRPGTIETFSKSKFVKKLHAKISEQFQFYWEKLAMDSAKRASDFIKESSIASSDDVHGLDNAVEQSRQELGPERHQVLKTFLLETVIKGKLIPKIETLENAIKDQKDLYENLKTMKLELQEEVKQMKHDLSETQTELLETKSALNDANQSYANLQQSVQTIEETNKRLTLENDDLSEENKMLSNEFEQILAGTKRQLEEYDQLLAELDQEKVGSVVHDLVTDVQINTLQRERDRFFQEREGLHTQLNQLLEKITTLPEIFQASFFVDN